MYSNDSLLKLKRNREKLRIELNRHHPSLMVGGLIGNIPALANSAISAGLSIVEPSHPAIALARGLFPNITDLNSAEKIRYKVRKDTMVDLVKEMRNLIGDDVLIGAGVPGVWNEDFPIDFDIDFAISLSQAGIDSLHTHKSTFKEIEEITKIAHAAGLMVDSFISENGILGVEASSQADVISVGKTLEKIGCDMIGILSSNLYMGKKSSLITQDYLSRLKLLKMSVGVPVIAEGGITLENFSVLCNGEADILIITSSIDEYIYENVKKIIKDFLLIGKEK